MQKTHLAHQKSLHRRLPDMPAQQWKQETREIIKALRIVLAHQAKLSEAWSKIHG